MSQVRLAFRTLFGSPLVTSVAIVSLALGIGANAAIFSMFDQMLLRALPVSEPSSLVNLSAPGPKPGSNSSNSAGRTEHVFSYPMFRDLEREQRMFGGLAAHRTFGANLAHGGQTDSATGLQVSGSYFGVLGIQPAVGRLFTEEDDRTPGAHPLVVLSNELWERQFGASPDVIGDAMIVNGTSLTIVGVTPRGFHGTTLGVRPEIYVPITMRGVLVPGWEGFENRRSYWVYVFGRLEPGVALEQAETSLNVTYGAIINEIEAPLQEGMSDETMARFKEKRVAVADGRRGQSVVRSEARAPLTLLLGVTGFVLLIACANVANLLLARGAGRASEMAVRLAIGASRRQLVGQLLLESCMLAALGGLAGVLTARWTLQVIHSMLPPFAALTIQPVLDPTVLGFAAALSIATGLAFGIFPALDASRPDLVSSLRGLSGQAGGSGAASYFRTAMATSQIALSMALLVAAGLFTRSLVNVTRVDLGLEADELITFSVSPELNGYTPDQSRAFFERMEDDLGALPGVSGVVASRVQLIAGNNWGTSVSVEGFEAGPDTDVHSQFNQVGPDFFKTLGIPLLAGREFTRADALETPKVAIVNEAFARKFNLGRDAVGRRMGTGRGDELDIEIVGLVPDAKYSEVKDVPPPQFVVPYRQTERVGSTNFYVRSAGVPDAVLTAIPGVVKRLDPNLPIEELRTMEMQVRENVFLDRFISSLATAFALLATLLAAVGLYGVLAYTVSQRTREFGLRMALGADDRRVRAMVLSRVAKMTAVGSIIGLLFAVALGRLAESLLFELEGNDPTVFAAALVTLTIVALVAGYLPARRASRIDPMTALRYE